MRRTVVFERTASERRAAWRSAATAVDQRRGALSGTFVRFGSVLCDLLDFCQQEPTFGQNKPRPSVLSIVAAVCLANAFSCFNATVVAFGHCDMMCPKAYLFLLQLVCLGRGDRRPINRPTTIFFTPG
jgi:hypothetical protein